MAEEIFKQSITAEFPDPHRLRSRDVLRLLRLCWPFIKPYRRDLGRLILMLLPAAAAGIFGLVLIRVFFDVIGNGHPLTHYEAWLLRLPLNASRQSVLMRTCIVGGAAALLGLPCAMFAFGYAVWLLQKISNLFRVSLYAQLQELSLNFHSEEKIGDAIFRMFQDSAGVPEIINGLLMQPLVALPVAVANLGWLLIFNGSMALIALFLIPIEFALASAFSEPLRRAFLDAREVSAQAITRIEETLASIKAVKAFTRESHEATIYADENWASLMAERKARMLLVVYRLLLSFVRGLGYLAVLYLGAREVLGGYSGGLSGSAISLGLFQGTVVAFNRIGGSSHDLASAWGNLLDVGVGLARVFEILRQHTMMVVGRHLNNGYEQPPPLRRGITFDRVSFGYMNSSTVLSNVDLEARAGELTAIVGPSGTGKSTLIALLLRFYDPVDGRVLLDGRDLRDFELESWRRMIAVALQNNPLLSGTLLANLTYGQSSASDEAIDSVLERTGLAEFVDTLPAGLKTWIGERGTKLSAGQAQRISVARALLRNAPILLLDEPTSALDTANEERLMRGVRAWLAEGRGHRMAIITTHQRSAAAWADRVYRIADGGTVEERFSRTGESSAAAGNA